MASNRLSIGVNNIDSLALRIFGKHLSGEKELIALGQIATRESCEMQSSAVWSSRIDRAIRRIPVIAMISLDSAA